MSRTSQFVLALCLCCSANATTGAGAGKNGCRLPTKPALAAGKRRFADSAPIPFGIPTLPPRGGADIAATTALGAVSWGNRLSRALSPPSIKDAPFVALAAASVGLAVTALVAGAGLLEHCLAWSTLVLGPSTAILGKRVETLSNMRDLTNELREEVNEIQMSNSALRKQNRRLSTNAQKLKNTQESLEQISSAQGISIDKLVDQVSQYGKIQEAIRADLRSKVQQTLMSVFLRSDADEDFTIDPEEVDLLVLRLNNIPSIEFNEARFRKAVKRDGGDIGKLLEDDGIFKF